MSRSIILTLTFGITLMLSTALVSASGEPSFEAKGMPGAAGTPNSSPPTGLCE